MSASAATSPVSPTFSTTSTGTALSSLGASKTFVSCLLVLPPASSPAASPNTAYGTGRRSSISAGTKYGGGGFTTLSPVTPEEDEALSPTTASEASVATPTTPASIPAFGAPKARPFGAPSDGGGKKRRGSRRPATSGVVLEDKSLSIKRASVAAGAGSSGVGHATSLTARSKALGYVDGVKGVFKAMGIPVSTLKSTALISSHITPTLPPTPPLLSQPLTSIPPITTHASTVSPSLTFILLIPLNDHSSYPPPSYTARLILESGKTPSSICFDLDSEIGGKEAEGWEEERLEGALRSLSDVDSKRKEGDWKGVGVVVVAYSSNPNLSDDVKRKCLDAGAELVLHPPYDILHPGVPVAIQGALDGALNHLHSQPKHHPAPPAIGSPGPKSTTIARSESAKNHPPPSGSPYNAPRRASVDTGGVSLAFSRALDIVEEIASVDDLDVGHEHSDDVKTELELAELLVGMHLETQRAVSGTSAEDEELLLRPITPDKRRELAGKMDTWGFEPHNLDETDLFRCAQMMFEGTMMIEGLWELDVTKSQIDSLILSVRQIYHAPNPYHNYIHATDVLQATYTFLALTGLVPPFALLGETPGKPAESWKRLADLQGRVDEVMRPEDIFAVVVAAIGHDAAHPGLSNVFMKNAKTPLSQVYNDTSVLENMHCLLITTLLRKHGFAFLFEASPKRTGLSDTAPDWTGFRKVLFSSIMATDMAMHFSWIVRLGQLGDKIAEGRCSMEEDEVWEDRIMICQALIKCSDISNPTRPLNVSEHWSTVLLEEWAQQAFLETGLHLPVSVAQNADAALQAKGQVGFIDLFVQPLFNTASEVVPQLERFASACVENRARWSERLANLTLASAPSIPIKPSKYSGPPLDLKTFTVPCAHDSPYRTVFPYTLPESLIAEIIEGKVPPSVLFEDSSSRPASVASSTPQANTPHSSAASTASTSRLTISTAESHKKSFRSAYMHGVHDASTRRRREGSPSRGSSFSPAHVRKPDFTRPAHGRKRSESYSSQ